MVWRSTSLHTTVYDVTIKALNNCSICFQDCSLVLSFSVLCFIFSYSFSRAPALFFAIGSCMEHLATPVSGCWTNLSDTNSTSFSWSRCLAFNNDFYFFSSNILCYNVLKNIFAQFQLKYPLSFQYFKQWLLSFWQMAIASLWLITSWGNISCISRVSSGMLGLRLYDKAQQFKTGYIVVMATIPPPLLQVSFLGMICINLIIFAMRSFDHKLPYSRTLLVPPLATTAYLWYTGTHHPQLKWS